MRKSSAGEIFDGGNMMKLVDNESLDVLTKKARESARKRMNLNLHDDPGDPVQRLCNAIEPGTYIRPHRHTNPGTMEVFLMLRGSAVLLLFHDDGKVRERVELSATGPVIAAEIPQGAWHAMASLEKNTIFFEVKKGPYVRPDHDNVAPWAPEEDSTAAARIVEWYRNALNGQNFPVFN